MGHDPQLRERESARLDSWKEIASFLHRDARTVRRWERDRRLPVHRVPGGERSGVFAYISELESWLRSDGSVHDFTLTDKVVVLPERGAPPSAKSVSGSEKIALVSDSKSHPVQVESAVLNQKGSLLDREDPAPEAPVEASSETAMASGLSALHSLNTVDAAFAEEAPHRAEAAGVVLPGVSAPRSRSHYVVLLLAFLTVAIGVATVFVHDRESRPLASAAHRPTPEAQELYLRGRYYWNLRTEDGLNRAVDLFTQSIVNDPHYAAAYAGLADSYLLLRQYGHMPNSEAFPRALAAARQAIALDGSSPEAHRSLAFILRFWNWDMAAAEKEYRRAIALNPADSQSHHWYATALLSSNRAPEALAEIDVARSLEPQSVSVLADRGLILSISDPVAGAAALQQVEQAQPDFLSTHVYLSGVYLQMGEYRGFLSESRSAATIAHDAAMLAILDKAQAVLDARGPQPMLHELAVGLAPLADRGTVPAYNVARFFGLAGEPQPAIHYLRVACDRREPGFLSVENDSAFSQLRSSPEYNTLLTRRDAAFGSSKQPIARLDAPNPF